MKTNLAPIEKTMIERSFTNIYRAGSAIPTLMELSRFIGDWCEGDHPTKKWCDELFDLHTQGEVDTAIECLARFVELEACRTTKTLEICDF